MSPKPRATARRAAFITLLAPSLSILAGCSRAEPRPNGTASCCVSSASARPSASAVPAASAEDAWRDVLAALRAGDDAALARVATPAGIASLEKGVSGESKHVAFARFGQGWAAWEIRWKKRDADRAEASLGPESKEHGLVFVRTPDGWKLDRWTPGE